MGKKKGKELSWLGFIGHAILHYSLWYVTLKGWDIHINELFLFGLIFNFMPLQDICCTWRSTSRLPLLAEKKSKKETVYLKWLNFFNVCVFTTHNQRFEQFAFQEVQFSHNTQRFFNISGFIDNKNVGTRGHKNKLPPPCSNTAYGQTYLNIFLVSAVYWCICPVLHQSSSKADSQGQASAGWSLNPGTSIMAPASPQLTLKPAQEKEDNKSQTQAAKAEIESTGNKIN